MARLRRRKQDFLDSPLARRNRGSVTHSKHFPDPATPLARESAAQAFTDILDGTAVEDGIEARTLA